MSYCNDVDGLMTTMEDDHKQEWQLLTDVTNASLKGVFLHIENDFLTFPVFHATHMKSHIRTSNFSSVASNITHIVGIFSERLKSHVSILARNSVLPSSVAFYVKQPVMQNIITIL